MGEVMNMEISRTLGRLRPGAMLVALFLAGTGLTACGSSDIGNVELVTQAIPKGQARLKIKRKSSILYAAAPAAITLDGKKVASLGSGGSTIINISTGKHVIGASAWSYPGTFKVSLNAKPGATYNIEVAPRGASFSPGALLGPLGGAIDASLNENAGAFQMRFVKE